MILLSQDIIQRYQESFYELFNTPKELEFRVTLPDIISQEYLYEMGEVFKEQIETIYCQETLH